MLWKRWCSKWPIKSKWNKFDNLLRYMKSFFNQLRKHLKQFFCFFQNLEHLKSPFFNNTKSILGCFQKTGSNWIHTFCDCKYHLIWTFSNLRQSPVLIQTLHSLCNLLMEGGDERGSLFKFKLKIYILWYIELKIDEHVL